jgi:hypothetical protein
MEVLNLVRKVLALAVTVTVSLVARRPKQVFMVQNATLSAAVSLLRNSYYGCHGSSL